MKKRLFTLGLTLALAVGLLGFGAFAHAQGATSTAATSTKAKVQLGNAGDELLSETQIKLLKSFNQLEDGTTLPILIGRIVRVAAGLLGTIAFILIVAGGVLFMIGSASGKDDDIKKAKDIILWSFMGLFVIFSAYAIVNLLFSAFPGERTPGSSDSNQELVSAECICEGSVVASVKQKSECDIDTVKKAGGDKYKACMWLDYTKHACYCDSFHVDEAAEKDFCDELFYKNPHTGKNYDKCVWLKPSPKVKK